jgi:CubicO group peptidase (beta-lactamase class C family)
MIELKKFHVKRLPEERRLRLTGGVDELSRLRADAFYTAQFLGQGGGNIMTKYKVFSWLVVLVSLIGMLANDLTITLAKSLPQQEPPLRLSEPVEAIVADLEGYIPAYMAEQHIPGVTIALIRDGEVAWTGSFGVANALTRRPVTAKTVFEWASNSKVVTAYIALRLVDQGLLSLDQPLNSYLPEPWLPPSEYRDVITLRHVLSHSSGLGQGTLSRGNLFPPGRGYSYSAIGFQYLQVVIEQVTGKSLEQVAREMVFDPLEMPFSSFVNRGDLTGRTANGHMHAILPFILYTALYLASLIIAGAIGLIIVRVRSRRWRPAPRAGIAILMAAFALSLLPEFIVFGLSNLVELAWLLAFYGLFLTTTFTLTTLAGSVLLRRICAQWHRLRRALMVVWCALVLGGLAFLSLAMPNLPVPRWPQTKAEAAASLRAPIGDMARFLIELGNPQHLSGDLATQMRTSQVRLSADLSWGLGPGIQHSQQGDALWQWGQHLDFQSILIIYPEQGFGVVVCTNSDFLNPNVALEIAHRALGGKIDPIRRAIHLEFNYREGDQ